jgi:hypothetical protein
MQTMRIFSRYWKCQNIVVPVPTQKELNFVRFPLKVSSFSFDAFGFKNYFHVVIFKWQSVP